MDASALGEVDRSSDHPVYQQIADRIRVLILDGTLREGQPIPSESVLMSHFGVARMTARQAVMELRRAGYVYAKQGSGVYVSPQGRRTIGARDHRAAIEKALVDSLAAADPDGRIHTRFQPVAIFAKSHELAAVLADQGWHHPSLRSATAKTLAKAAQELEEHHQRSYASDAVAEVEKLFGAEVAQLREELADRDRRIAALKKGILADVEMRLESLQVEEEPPAAIAPKWFHAGLRFRLTDNATCVITRVGRKDETLFWARVTRDGETTSETFHFPVPASWELLDAEPE